MRTASSAASSGEASAHLLHGNPNARERGLFSLWALQEAAVPAKDLVLVIASHAAEGLIHIHQWAVWQVGVCNGDPLQSQAKLSFPDRRQDAGNKVLTANNMACLTEQVREGGFHILLSFP